MINKRDTSGFSLDLDMGGPPELKSDEKQDVSLLFIEIWDCEHFFTAEKVLPFIGAPLVQRREDNVSYGLITAGKLGPTPIYLRHVTQTASMRSDVEYSSNPTYGSCN